MLALVLLAGCGSKGGGGGGGSGLSDSAEGRRRMPSCGTYNAGDGELAPADRAVRDCFLAAFGAGEQKEVTITATSIEGDPITTIYRVLGPDDLELFVDASTDKFAAVKTYHQRCRTLAEDGNGLTAGACSTVS